MINTVSAAFDRFEDAIRVTRDLQASGFVESEINIVAHEMSTHTVCGAGAGLNPRFLGLALKNVGVVNLAGPIAATVAGTVEQATAGGLIAAFTDLGIAQHEAENYVEIIRRGGALIVLRTDPMRTLEAENTLRRNHSINIAERTVRWRNSGWPGFDPDATALTAEQIAVEQEISINERARELAETELRR